MLGYRVLKKATVVEQKSGFDKHNDIYMRLASTQFSSITFHLQASDWFVAAAEIYLICHLVGLNPEPCCKAAFLTTQPCQHLHIYVCVCV